MKKYCREVLIGGVVTLIVTPLIIAFMVNVSLIKTDTDNAWIGFWGSYLGSIIGGAISGCIAMYVLVKTLKDNKRAQQREEVVDFCNMLVSKGGEFAQKCEAAMYAAVEYAVHKRNGQIDLESYKVFLSEQHSGKVILYEILEHLEIRKDIQAFRTEHIKELVEFTAEFYEMFRNYEHEAVGEDGIKKEELDIRLNKFLNLLSIYKKELLLQVSG